MSAALAASAVLLLLAVYHLGMGALSTLAPRGAARLGAALYGVEARETPQLRYGLRMLGLYALAVGTLCGVAATDPPSHRVVIATVAGLQLARALARIGLEAEVTAAFGVSAARNRLNAALLVTEAAILLVALPLL